MRVSACVTDRAGMGVFDPHQSFFSSVRRAATRLTGGSSVIPSRGNANSLPTRSSPRTWHRVVVVGLLLGLLVPAPAFPADETQDKILEWSLPGLPEPSGVVYHAKRGSLFVVSDDGTIGEVTVDGKVRATRALGGDLEGITYDPGTGYLYIVREGHEIIFEVDPNGFAIRRRFTIDRSFEGDADFLERGGDGIEGLTFVPNPDHREGGRFFAVNQFDPPALVELALPLRSSQERFEKARVVAAHRIASPPLSDVLWSPELRAFLIPSALWRSVYVVDEAGSRRASVRVPGIMQEGIALLPDGAVVIAQDTGGLIKWHPPKPPFEAVAVANPETVGTSGTHSDEKE